MPAAEGTPPGTESVPAATTVLLRDGAAGLETLMLRRSSNLAFAAGMWVFPGGRIDPEDTHPERPEDEEAAARRAAAREAREEADLVLSPDELLVLSRWCPPPEAPRRFNTWFFVGAAPVGAVTVDGGEIDDHLWIQPREALERRDRGEIGMIPPTWITLHQLESFDDVASALGAIASWEPVLWQTKLVAAPEPSTRIVCWEPDVAYTGGALDGLGPRNRLVMHDRGWRYERSD
jgi:8-oxo-dGTP pyrophosphatase MutT (NUDIX family)